MNLHRFTLLFVVLLGIAESLLLTRFVMQLLAARPENRVVQIVLGVTEPLLVPLAWLFAPPPTYGAKIELASLGMSILILIVLLILRWYVGQNTRQTSRHSVL